MPAALKVKRRKDLDTRMRSHTHTIVGELCSRRPAFKRVISRPTECPCIALAHAEGGRPRFRALLLDIFMRISRGSRGRSVFIPFDWWWRLVLSDTGGFMNAFVRM